MHFVAMYVGQNSIKKELTTEKIAHKIDESSKVQKTGTYFQSTFDIR